MPRSAKHLEPIVGRVGDDQHTFALPIPGQVVKTAGGIAATDGATTKPLSPRSLTAIVRLVVSLRLVARATCRCRPADSSGGQRRTFNWHSHPRWTPSKRD